MNRSDIIKHKELMWAFANGKSIQYFDTIQEEWLNTESPIFSSNERYRLKPEPTYIPFTFEDRLAFQDRWIKLKLEGREYVKRIIAIHRGYIQVGNLSQGISYNEALKEWEFDDGTPFGKLNNNAS